MDGSKALTIRQESRLKPADHLLIEELMVRCMDHDGITLKLELDYKAADAANSPAEVQGEDINEFLCFHGQELIGYIGIASFGGPGAPLEITGMVHPGFRRQGVFSRLHQLVVAQCRQRQAERILLLCDRASVAGVGFLKKIQAEYRFSEYEMHLTRPEEAPRAGGPKIRLRKAGGADALEIARQNRIYFDLWPDLAPDDTSEGQILPEAEEQRGVTIYLAEEGAAVIGKVHLQLLNGLGGIYGLGVLPECRGRGFGREILRQAITAVKEAGARDIMLQVEASNARALSLYRSCGFQETSVMDYYAMDP